MSDARLKSLFVLVVALLAVLGVLFARPDYFSSTSMLATVIGTEILLMTIAKFRQVFLPVLLWTFLSAGSALPFHAEMLRARWIFLGVGAVVGFAIYMKERNESFSSFHLVACFCMLSALVSASVSEYPQEALLKAVSLVILFIYAASGARVAVMRNAEAFFRKLLVACEILTWGTGLAYGAFHWHFYGNPNSLGAIMGVAVVPTLLWGLLTVPDPRRRRLLGVELLLALALLMSSYARASIGAAALAFLLLCVASRHYRLLARGIAISLVVAVCIAVFVPNPEEDRDEVSQNESVATVYLYKGHQAMGVFGSRKTPWEDTWHAIRNHPWFGSGFGTSIVTEDMSTKLDYAKTHIDSWVIREHGNSYLAIAEWSGILGVLPFYSLIILTGLNVRRVFSWLRHTGDLSSPAVVAAAIGAAGLFHAGFEDWMFAVGYYLSVFFWVIMFVLVDLTPRKTVVYAPGHASQYDSPPFASPVVWVR